MCVCVWGGGGGGGGGESVLWGYFYHSNIRKVLNYLHKVHKSLCDVPELSISQRGRRIYLTRDQNSTFDPSLYRAQFYRL